MPKTKLFFSLALILLLSSALAAAVPLQDLMIAYTFKNPDGTVFRIIKYYLKENNKFRTEYYSTVTYNISGNAEGQVSDSNVSGEANAEMKSEYYAAKEPHTIEILRKDKKLVWSIDTEFKYYIEVPLKEDSWDHSLMNIFFTGMPDFKKIGEMKLLGFNCETYESTTKVQEESWTNIFYVAKEINLILKTELLKNGNLVQTMEATEVKMSRPSDSLFEVPDGYKKNENN